MVQVTVSIRIQTAELEFFKLSQSFMWATIFITISAIIFILLLESVFACSLFYTTLSILAFGLY